MPVYTCDPKAEVIGENVIAFLENTHTDEIRPYLEKHGLTEIDPEKWYPLQKWLDVLTDLSQVGDSMFNLISIGMAISGTAVLPPEAEQLSLVQFLEGIDTVYQIQHRGADVGRYWVEHVDENHVKLFAQVVYPDDLEYGVIYGFVRRWLPRGTRFTVKYDERLPRKEDGGEYTIIHVMWD